MSAQTILFDIMPDPTAVNSMFSRIAARYDTANKLLSGGVDRWWRRRLVSVVRKHKPLEVLDLATGSGDVAFALAKGMSHETRITGMDFCQPMLDQAVIKQSGIPGTEKIRFLQGDGLALPLDAACMDAVTISFGLRNMADRHRALSEMRRVLRPGGLVHVLEFSQPYGWFKPFYYFYLRYMLPTLAGLITGDKAAYEYLNASIESYPDHAAMSEELAKAGFKNITVIRMTGGIVALHSAVA